MGVRQFLDRRRLEEGFLLYACLKVVEKYGLPVMHIPYDKNKLVECVAKQYESVFYQQWTGNNVLTC